VPRDERPTTPFSTLWRATRIVAAWAVIILIVAILGVYIGNLAERTSVDYRTAEATEVHKNLAEPFIHLGDNKPVTKVKLGQTFYVHNVYAKMDTCHVFVSNVYWGETNHIAHHYSMFTNWFPKTERVEANEVFIATPELPPGRYHIVKKTVSFCSGKEHYSTNFDIVVDFVR
jgi:hypothetical protein